MPGAVIAANLKSVSYTAPDIASSAAGSAPFSFTVKDTGTIGAVLTVSASAVGAPFTDMLAPTAAVNVAAGGTQVYSAGLSWGPLVNADLGTTVSITYTVACTVAPTAG
jgi:hypothetical protein